MFLLPLLAIGIAVILLCGGKLHRFGDVRLHKPWLLVSAAILGMFIPTMVNSNASDFPKAIDLASSVAWIVSFPLIAAFFFFNREYRGLVVAGIGAMCNAIAVSVAGGTMPVGKWAYEVGGEGKIEPTKWASESAAWPLSDVLAAPFLPLSTVFSVGDVLLGIGCIWFAAAVMLKKPSQTTSD
jgi:hypothetical protein